VSFKPEISATYGLAVVLNGTPLQGSPFKIRIRNDETIAGNCRLYGPGLTLGTAGQRSQFCIQGKCHNHSGRQADMQLMVESVMSLRTA
jgi:hypothetical protein